MKEELLIQFNKALCTRLEQILPGVRGFIFGAEPTEGHRDPMDEVDLACARNELEFSMRLHQRNRHLFQEIIHALGRIRSGEFGICQECGSDIEVKRLEVQPTAAVCLECMKRAEATRRLKAA